LRRRRGKALAPRFGFVFDQHRIDVLVAVRLMLAPTCLQAGLQPFDIVFVDDADLSPIVLVPLSKLFSHLGCGAAIESDGLDLGHVVLPSPVIPQFYQLLSGRAVPTERLPTYRNQGDVTCRQQALRKICRHARRDHRRADKRYSTGRGLNMRGQRNNATSGPEVVQFARAAQSAQEDD
jgi:hypothetical protein